MEVGAVIGAAPRDAVVRERPAAGDLIILLGGRTGRDGMGGATGAQGTHHQVLSECGAEVRSGNAPNERKIQRLFRDPEVTRPIKRCNDFAGGVSVASGNWRRVLWINLTRYPRSTKAWTARNRPSVNPRNGWRCAQAAGDLTNHGCRRQRNLKPQ